MFCSALSAKERTQLRGLNIEQWALPNHQEIKVVHNDNEQYYKTPWIGRFQILYWNTHSYHVNSTKKYSHKTIAYRSFAVSTVNKFTVIHLYSILVLHVCSLIRQ